VAALQAEVDALYRAYFDGLVVPAEESEGDDAEQLPEWTAAELTEAAFAELGRTQTALMSRLLKVAAGDSAAWTVFQSRAQDLVLRRNRTKGSVEVSAMLERRAGLQNWRDDSLSAYPMAPLQLIGPSTPSLQRSIYHSHSETAEQRATSYADE